MRGNKSGVQVDACAVVAPTEWQKRKVSQEDRLYTKLLEPASKARIDRMPDAARWYCAAVVRGAEFALESKFSVAGVEALAPREAYDFVKKGKKIDGERPVFRGYVFVRFVPSAEAFQALKSLDEVRHFLGDGRGYRPILDAHMAVLKRFSPKVDVDRMAADKTIGQGQKVDIIHGAFAGFSGVVLQVVSGRSPKARVSIAAFGDLSRDVQMPLAFLQKL